VAIRVVSIISRMNVGGPAVLLKELIDNLPESEFEHILITGRCLSNEIDYLEEHPIQSRVIYIDSLKRSIFPTRDFLSFVKMIILLRKLRPNIVHTHTSKAGILGRVATKIASPQTKIVHTFHGHLLYGYFPKWKVRVFIALEIMLGWVTDKLIAVTSQVKIDLENKHVGKSDSWAVIHPGVKQSKNSIKSKIPLKNLDSEHEFSIVWVGRFTNIKNPMLAIKSVQRLRDLSPLPIKLHMVGGGELLEDCEKYAASMSLPVIFHGWTQQVRFILEYADVLLMTSQNEGLPIVILEAAASGVATLTTDVGGVGEFISQNLTGWLTEQSADAIASSLIEIAADQTNRMKVASRALDLFTAEYTADSFVEKHKRLYRDLLPNCDSN